MNTYHFLFGCLAAAVFALVVAPSQELLSGAPFLEVFLLVPLCWSLLLESICLADMPDLVADPLVAVYVLGCPLFLGRVVRALSVIDGGAQRHYGVLAQFCTYYSCGKFSIFLRAYPKFH